MRMSVSKLRCSALRLLNFLQSTQVPADEYRALQEFLNTKVYSEKIIETLLRFASTKLLDERFTIAVAIAFENIILLLIAMAAPVDEDVNQLFFKDYQKKCVALAQLMHTSAAAKWYSAKYFRNKPAPFDTSKTGSMPKNKRHKNESNPSSNPLNFHSIIKCCFQLLNADPVFFREQWNWSMFIEEYVAKTNQNDLSQVFCQHIIAMLTNMSTPQLAKLTANIPSNITVEFYNDCFSHLEIKNAYDSNPLTDEDLLITMDLCNDLIVDIEGVFLPIFNKDNYKLYTQTDGDGGYDKIVKVDSTKVNLRSIAMGVASSKAVCLSGSVGSGKTTLVEYLARITGRISPKPNELERRHQTGTENSRENCTGSKKQSGKPCLGDKRKNDLESDVDLNRDIPCSSNGFLRIQLGDQTDSKMLLGQYRCTDVPGEFIWLPGVLTQAVMNGYWLLLEDLDSATQDTYTILSSLLENNFLSVPGFRDCVKISPGFQLFFTVRTNKSSANTAQKSLYSLLGKYLYTINILPLSRNELCKVVSTNYPKLATVANRIVDVFLTFSSGDHSSADYLRQQEMDDKADTTEQYLALPFEDTKLTPLTNSGRLVSTRDLIKLCQRSDPVFSVTSTECAYFVFQNAVDIFCSYLAQGNERTKLITSIGAKLGIIQSRCEFFANEYKPEVVVDGSRIKVGRAELFSKSDNCGMQHTNGRAELQAIKRQKLSECSEKVFSPGGIKKSTLTFSFTRMASCILERIAVCVTNAEPVLLVGETGVGKTSSVQYLAERTKHKLVVVNMNNQSDVSDLVGGFKPVDLSYIVAPLRTEFEMLFRKTFNAAKNETFLNKFGICYNQGNFSVIIKLMIKVVNSVFEKSKCNELRQKELEMLPRWQELKTRLLKLNSQLAKSINISFAFIPGSLVNCIQNGDWILLDEINLASAETLECLSTILEPDGSVVLLEKGDFTPVKRHSDFRIFACMNPNTDIGKKDLPVGIRNRFTEFFVDELTTDSDLSLLISDYLSSTGIQKKSVTNIVRLYRKLKQLSKLELNDGLGNRPVFSLRTLCRSLFICAKNLCGSIERNLYESFCMSFLTQLDTASHTLVLQLITEALLNNAKAVLKQQIPKPGEDYLNFEGYWIQQGPKELQDCSNYILTKSVKENLKDLARIISIGKLPILLQGPTSAGKTSLIEYVAKRSGNHCMRINNHEHTDLQEYIGTYVADVTGKLSFKEGVLVQAMRKGYWIILDELNLASTDILEALNRVLDDNRELFIPETQTVVKAHPNFMLFATQNPPGLYGGRKTLSRAFKNRFIELHYSDIPRNELEIILEKRCVIPASYAKRMVMCMADLQKNRKTTSKNAFTLRDLFRWGNRYTFADKKLLEDKTYDWNQHLIEEGYLVLSAKVRTEVEIQIIEETLYRNFKKRIYLERLFDVRNEQQSSPVTKDIITAIRNFRERADIVWTQNMTRMAVLTSKALQFNEPVLLVGPTGCGKTTVCQILASLRNVKLRILNCHMHTEGADFLGGLRPCRQTAQTAGGVELEKPTHKLFEWVDGPLILAMQEGSYFMADEISLAEDSVLERLNCILEPERTVLLSEKGGVAGELEEVANDFVIRATEGFQFLATMNPGGDFGKKELSPALRNRFTEIWCLPSNSREDLIQIACNCMAASVKNSASKKEILKTATYLVEIVLYMRNEVEKFNFSIRDILAWANYMIINKGLSFPEKAIFGLETIFLDALEMLPHESLEKVENLKTKITDFAIKQAEVILNETFSHVDLEGKHGDVVEQSDNKFGIRPFYIPITAYSKVEAYKNFLFDAPTTKKNLFRLLSALSLKKPILLEGPPGVGKTSTVESIARAIGYKIVRINLCEHTDLTDLFGTDLPAEDTALTRIDAEIDPSLCTSTLGSFVWRDGPLLAALKAEHTWILLDELNLAPQSVLEGLNAILDHRGEVYIPELNKTFLLDKETRIFACQNPLKQGGGRKGLPQSFLNRFNKVYLRKLTTQDLLYVVNGKYEADFKKLRAEFVKILKNCTVDEQNLFDLYKKIKIRKPQNENVEVEVEYKSDDLSFDLSARLVKFSEMLENGIASMEFGYKGGPYEINLRDILRWCDLLIHRETGFISKTDAASDPLSLFEINFERFLLILYERMKLIYYQRMRCDQDKMFIRNSFAKTFNCDAEYLNGVVEDVSLYWTDDKIYLNDIVLDRTSSTSPLRSLKNKDLSTLLLSSHREILKNLIECVHMEKPVLLCGPAAAGKTKLIDALCTLSNQSLNTDVIDDTVTGSFQQVDLNRHLEEISQSIEGLLLSYVQSVFINGGSLQVTANLLSRWSCYKILERTQSEFNSNTALAEELVIFRRRIQRLNCVIEELLSAPNIWDLRTFKNDLEQQQRLLELLQHHTRDADSLNTGGSFEWVDSKIVKSLKLGQYILLDHVNLCSSAVLDRLNPVFEPNGSLLISEKGVTWNECFEIVEKAPNFRAFLTIDPKNGELSRAMRNRCVELALPRDMYSVDDIRTIIYIQGVKNIHAINCILRIHERLQQLTEICNFNLSHLTQFGFLTASYERIGYGMNRAIYVSGMEVYVYSACTDFMGYGLAYYQNKLREIVLEESQSLNSSAAHNSEDHLRNVILDCEDLNKMALIKLQTEPLKLLLTNETVSQQDLTNLFSQFKNGSALELQRDMLLKFYIYMMYESSSYDDLNLRFCYLQKILSSHPQLLHTSGIFYECIKQFHMQYPPIFKQLPWNFRLVPRIRDYSLATTSPYPKAFNLSLLLVVRSLLPTIPQQNFTKLAQSNALTYSQAVAAKALIDRLDNAFITHFSTFMTEFTNILDSTLSSADFGVNTFCQMITRYLWFNRLLEASLEKLFVHKECNTTVMDKLVLHFKWLDKNLLQPLSQISPNYRHVNIAFERSLLKLQNYVLSVKLPLNLIRKVYHKQMTHFQPFHQKDRVQLFHAVQQMDYLLSVVPSYGCFTPQHILKKFKAQKLDACKRARTIINGTAYDCFDYKFKEFTEMPSGQVHISQELHDAMFRFFTSCKETQQQDQIEQPLDLNVLLVEIQSLECVINSQDELLDSDKPKDIDLGVLALREYYLNKTLTQAFCASSSVNEPISLTYCDEIAFLSNSTWQLIHLMSTTKYQKFSTCWSHILENIDNFEQLFTFLSGCYRNFNTYHFLISNALHNQQLNNLATRFNCTRALDNANEVDFTFVYQGPTFLHILISLVFQSNGNLKPVPLNDLDFWRGSLKTIQQLLWHNSTHMTPTYNILVNNMAASLQNARKLIREVEYVQRHCENLENENFDDYNEGFQKLVEKLSNIYIETKATEWSAKCGGSYREMLYQSSLLNALIGAVELCLLTFTPLIDPVEKSHLKSAYIAEDIDCLTTLTTVYDFLKTAMKYKNFGSEIYTALEEQLNVLKGKQQKYSHKVALRPETCLYSSLVQDITHFLNTNCEPQALFKLIESAQKEWMSLNAENCKSQVALTLEVVEETLNKMNLWLANAQRFLHHTLRKYSDFYQDFVQPLQCSIGHLRFGMEGLKTVLWQVKSGFIQRPNTNSYVNINKDDVLQATLANIVEFPSAHSLAMNDNRCGSEAPKKRAGILGILDKISAGEHNHIRLLRAKLIEVRNLVSVTSAISVDTFRELDFVFNAFNRTWQEEEELRRQKKVQDESLYVSKVKCETENEELEEMREIEEHFPTSVQVDFGEFVIEDTLEKVIKDKKNATKSQHWRLVQDEDYAFLGQNFIEIMEQYSEVYYHDALKGPKSQKQLEFVEPFKERVQVFVELFHQYGGSLNEWLDEVAYNSLGFVIGLQQQQLNEISLTNQQKRPYNFYKDSNIPEIIACTDVLNRIEVRVNEQLDLYPEHASLVDIKRVLERIRTLPSTSPVVRFNTGFQILRQKLSQWNEVAHKGNHLRDEEVEVAAYVQKWTKLELQFWRNCLSQSYEKMESSAYKYWFFIYNMLQEYIQDNEVDSSYTEMKYTERRFGAGEILDSVDVKKKSKIELMDIVHILRQFIESAHYGDFHVRMHLLQAFELYLHHIDWDSADKKNELIASLRNLQIYFSQFGQEIEETKNMMRTPIEKKLKEFVKIESYNKDLSYFSMRNNVARVHRNLNKFLKEYQEQLQQKITPVFQPKDATVKDYNFENDKGRELRYDTKIKYCLVDVKIFVAPQKLQEMLPADIAAKNDAESLSLVQKVGRLFKTSRNVVKETVSNASYPKLIIALDVLLSEQLERCEHLRSLTVDRSRDRPKQVLEAKQILQQKRKGLTDLFKILTQLGVSYKTGLMEMSLRTEYEDFSIAPFSIKTMFGTVRDKRIQINLLHLNENLEKYYVKCVFKLKLLQNIMLTPLSELGPPNIERIKGFAVDMFLLIQNQRRLLASTTKQIYDLGKIVKNIKDLNETVRESSFDFLESRHEFDALKSSLCRIRYVFEQYSLLLNCVPKEESAENHVLSSNCDILLQDSPLYVALTKAVDDILRSVKDALANMMQYNDSEFMSRSKLDGYRKVYHQIVTKTKQITDSLRSSITGDQTPLTKSLSDLLQLVEETTSAKLTTKTMFALDCRHVDCELENILHSILLSLQKLYKRHPKISLNSSVSDEAAKGCKTSTNSHETDNFDLQEGHLKKGLSDELAADWSLLNMPNVVTKLSNVLLTVKLSAASKDEKLACIRKICSLLPLLEQYHLMADFYLFQQLGAHKVSAKILSIMLTVFVEIGTKGFCVPADLMQDEEGQSKKDEKKGEGFGLEDGTGENDVSDKIESEDQLDDAKRPEDRKNDEGQQQQQDDCKEEKGIDMSEDFDGKVQDIEKPEDEENNDSGESEDEEDMSKEMGETEEGADKLDEQIWGDDEEPEMEEEERDLDEEQEGKGNKDESDAHNDLDAKNEAVKNDGTEEHDKDGLDATNESGRDDKKQQKQNDIDDMKDLEMDDDQINPYHNELEEPPEADEMDLGDMNNVDQDVDNQDEVDEQQSAENPFDIDKMKENMQIPEDNGNEESLEKDDDKEEENGENSEDSNSEDEGDARADELGRDDDGEEQLDEDDTKDVDENEPETQKRGELEMDPLSDEQPEEESAEKREEKPEEYEQSKDKASKEDNVQSIPETESKGSADLVHNDDSENDVKQEQKMDEQETGEEKDGVGQAENDMDESGHQGIAETKETVSKEDRRNERRKENEKRKQGRTNEERTIGEAEKNELKQLKTIDKLHKNNDKEDKDNECEQREAENVEYQHVKEPKNSDKTTLDNATEEQSKQINHQEDENQDGDLENDENNPEDLTEPTEEAQQDANANEENIEEMMGEKFDQKSEKPSKSEQTNQRTETQEEMEIEGEIVQTVTVPRSDETTAHCIKEILIDTATQPEELSGAQQLELRKLYQQQVTTSKASMPHHEDYETWQSISNRMAQNARDLCEQLRLILEPTKCTRLKGDYRTGRRINMKKIIPYIASQFRKDKIWLRRTKPAQRDYKITIAIDDSKSMHHNNSKTLTLEAISLVSQALTLLESGRLSVISFGESPQIILNHTEQFDGPKLVNSLNFAQDKTKIAELLDYIRTVNTEEGALGGDNGLFENLLLVLSDGRNIFSEGKTKVKSAIKLTHLQRIFLVYIIIDNPENKNSILDIQTMEVLPDKRINIKSYLDDFPFPYYVIVRDLNQLPLVLSEAMRQWFELVNSEE